MDFKKIKTILAVSFILSFVFGILFLGFKSFIYTRMTEEQQKKLLDSLKNNQSVLFPLFGVLYMVLVFIFYSLHRGQDVLNVLEDLINFLYKKML